VTALILILVTPGSAIRAEKVDIFPGIALTPPLVVATVVPASDAAAMTTGPVIAQTVRAVVGLDKGVCDATAVATWVTLRLPAPALMERLKHKHLMTSKANTVP